MKYTLLQIRQRAFTLVETIIVVALGTSMMIVLGLLIYNFNTTVVYEQTLAQSSGSASAVMREIESLALPADAVLQMHTFSGVPHNSSATELILEIPSIDNSGNVIANTYDYARFYLVGTDVYRHLEAYDLSSRTSGTKRLGSTVQTLTFIYNNSDFPRVSAITVDVQTRAQVKQNVLSYHLREYVRLRNY